jgi:hypothetical protein
VCFTAASAAAQGRRTSRGNSSQQQPAAQPQQQQEQAAPVPDPGTQPVQPAFDFSRYRGKTEFRNVPWGASKEDILRQDKQNRKETGVNHLILNQYFSSDVNFDIVYFFWRNNLIKGVYVSTNNIGEYSKYLEKYNYFKELLKSKHGKPYIDTANWHSMELRNEPNKWLLAVQRGQLEHFAIWEKDGIVVNIKFCQINGMPRIMMEYYIANIDSDIERTDDKEILKDL